MCLLFSRRRSWLTCAFAARGSAEQLQQHALRSAATNHRHGTALHARDKHAKRDRRNTRTSQVGARMPCSLVFASVVCSSVAPLGVRLSPVGRPSRSESASRLVGRSTRRRVMCNATTEENNRAQCATKREGRMIRRGMDSPSCASMDGLHLCDRRQTNQTCHPHARAA